MDLPKSLPPAPSTAPRQEQPPPELADSQFTNFDQVKQNYINMLNQKSEIEPPVAEEVAAMSLAPSDIANILAMIQASPGLGMMSPETPDLYTSPEFSTSPEFDGLEDYLVETPLIAEDDFLTGMSDGEPLFPPMPEFGQSPPIDYNFPLFSSPAEKVPAPAFPSTQGLYTFTPESPMLHDFGVASINPASLVRSPLGAAGPNSFSSPAMPSSPFMAPPMNRRKSSATGTRKGLTTEALVPIDAPTQARRYITPSATSKKDLPATFARKRARSTAFGDEDEDHLEPLGPNATEFEQIEYKRRQNTIAARRSRARKLQHQQELETKIDDLTREKDAWKERALMCQQMLVAHGIRAPSFED